MESIDRGIWDVVVNAPFVLMHVVKDETIKKTWSESRKTQYDFVAKNIITPTLNLDEFFRVSQCISAKEMWDIL